MVTLEGLDVFRVKKDESDIYKYVTGRYDTPEAAKAKVSEVRKKFPDAFVVKVSGDDVIRL